MSPWSQAPSDLLVVGFATLALVMAALVGRAAGVRAALGIAAWLLCTALLAAGGYLAHFTTPPRPLLVFAVTLVGVVWLSSRDRLLRWPLSWLIGLQSFRVLVELLIHRAVAEGVAPPQMTWPPVGLNVDVITGVTALVVGPLAPKLPRSLLWFWNIAGLAMLLWIVGVAVLSMPTPWQRLRPDNTWVAWWPFVWLPVVLVGCALLGHLLVFRKLVSPTSRPNPNRAPARA